MINGRHMALLDMAYIDGHFEEESEWKVVELPCQGNVEEIIRIDNKVGLRMSDGHYFTSDDLGSTWIGPLDRLDRGTIQSCLTP